MSGENHKKSELYGDKVYVQMVQQKIYIFTMKCPCDLGDFVC